MSYNRNISALCFGDLKAAALYFDRIVPVAFRSLRGDKKGLFLEAPDPVPVKVIVKLIFGDEAPDYLVISYLDDYWSPFMRGLNPFLKNRKGSSLDLEAYTELKTLYLSNSSSPKLGSVRSEFAKFAKKLGVPSYSVLLPDETPTASFTEAYSCLVASKLPLIDASTATWDQIIELRRSPEAKIKLRRLRLFFFENYTGKPKSYVEDDLLRRLDDYEKARREFGFDTITSSISVLLDSQNLQASLVAGLAAALFGGPTAAISAGASVELGKFSLEVAKKRAQIRSLSDGHELAYIIAARRHLKS
jgi:hypothetical protein